MGAWSGILGLAIAIALVYQFYPNDAEIAHARQERARRRMLSYHAAKKNNYQGAVSGTSAGTTAAQPTVAAAHHEPEWEVLPVVGGGTFSYRIVHEMNTSTNPTNASDHSAYVRVAELRLHIPSVSSAYIAIGISPGPFGGVNNDIDGADNDDAFANFMTGPPHSEAVVGLGKDTIGIITLDDMPPSRLDFSDTTTGKETDSVKLAAALNVALGTANHSASLSRTADSGTTLQFRAKKVGSWPLPTNTPVHVIYAFGSDELIDDAAGSATSAKLAYHGRARRGVFKSVIFNKPAQNHLHELYIPYYELHGGCLTFIWSVTTLLGGVLARYCRAWSGWIDAHQLLQTIASLLSFPLTILSFISKDEAQETHYNSAHGMLGLLFSLSATAQGLLGTYAHMTFAHEFACSSNNHWRIAIIRRIHRVLGKTLLVVAILQISLGIQQYDSTIWSKLTNGVFNIAAIFLLYTVLVWAGIAILEYRHRMYQRHKLCGGRCGSSGIDSDVRHNMKDFKPMTGAGYCNARDLAVNNELYLMAVKIVDEIMEAERVDDKWASIGDWVAHRGSADISCAVKLFRIPLRFVYLFGHRSMKTREILDYARFLEKRHRQNEIVWNQEGKKREDQQNIHRNAHWARIEELLNRYGSHDMEIRKKSSTRKENDDNEGEGCEEVGLKEVELVEESCSEMISDVELHL